MKNKTKIIISVVIFVILVIVMNSKNKGPLYFSSERRNVTRIVEEYLTKKYGDHNFKVTDIDYEYDMRYVFDYSTKDGYLVGYKSDVVNSAVSVYGIYPNIENISDWFLEDYYFGEKGVSQKFVEMRDLAPEEEIRNVILNKLKNEFDANALTVESLNTNFELPDDFGRIPTIDEIKTSVDLYRVSVFSYTTMFKPSEQYEYEIRLKEYLNNSFDGDWFVNTTQKDNLYSVYCSGNSFSIGDILNK